MRSVRTILRGYGTAFHEDSPPLELKTTRLHALKVTSDGVATFVLSKFQSKNSIFQRKRKSSRREQEILDDSPMAFNRIPMAYVVVS